MDSKCIMNNEIIVAEAMNNINFKDIESMMDGCDQAAVIMGINCFTHKFSRIVVAYNSVDINFEEAVMGANRMVDVSNFSISRAFIYSIKGADRIIHLDHINYRTRIYNNLKKRHE